MCVNHYNKEFNILHAGTCVVGLLTEFRRAAKLHLVVLTGFGGKVGHCLAATPVKHRVPFKWLARI